MSVEKIAMDTAIKFFEHNKYTVVNVAKSREKDHEGYDLLVRKYGHSEKIEVKGTSNEWKIPDLYYTEVGADGKLIADYLMLVYVQEGEAKTICKIPRDVFKPEEFAERRGYRISEAVKNSERLKDHILLIDKCEEI